MNSTKTQSYQTIKRLYPALAGLNSWFKVVDGGEVFNGICTFAGILLGVTICITPFMMVVEKMSRRKKRREVQEREPHA